MGGGVSGPMGHRPIQGSFQSHGPQKTPTEKKTDKLAKSAIKSNGSWFSSFRTKKKPLFDFNFISSVRSIAKRIQSLFSRKDLPQITEDMKDSFIKAIAYPTEDNKITIQNEEYTLTTERGTIYDPKDGEDRYLDKIIATTIIKNPDETLTKKEIIFCDRRDLGKGFTCESSTSSIVHSRPQVESKRKTKRQSFELLNTILTEFTKTELKNDGQRIQLLNKIVDKTVTGENRDYLDAELHYIDLESSIESKAVDSHTEKYNRIKQTLDKLPDSPEKFQVIFCLENLVKKLGVTTS